MNHTIIIYSVFVLTLRLAKAETRSARCPIKIVATLSIDKYPNVLNMVNLNQNNRNRPKMDPNDRINPMAKSASKPDGKRFKLASDFDRNSRNPRKGVYPSHQILCRVDSLALTNTTPVNTVETTILGRESCGRMMWRISGNAFKVVSLSCNSGLAYNGEGAFIGAAATDNSTDPRSQTKEFYD